MEVSSPSEAPRLGFTGRLPTASDRQGGGDPYATMPAPFDAANRTPIDTRDTVATL